MAVADALLVARPALCNLCPKTGGSWERPTSAWNVRQGSRAPGLTLTWTHVHTRMCRLLSHPGFCVCGNFCCLLSFEGWLVSSCGLSTLHTIKDDGQLHGAGVQLCTSRPTLQERAASCSPFTYGIQLGLPRQAHKDGRKLLFRVVQTSRRCSLTGPTISLAGSRAGYLNRGCRWVRLVSGLFQKLVACLLL